MSSENDENAYRAIRRQKYWICKCTPENAKITCIWANKIYVCLKQKSLKYMCEWKINAINILAFVHVTFLCFEHITSRQNPNIWWLVKVGDHRGVLLSYKIQLWSAMYSYDLTFRYFCLYCNISFQFTKLTYIIEKLK